MRSPPLIFFLIVAFASLLGIMVNVPIVFGVALFGITLVLAFLTANRFAKSLLLCGALVAFVSTISAHQKRKFDQTLNSLSSESHVYEGVILDLSDTLSGDKIGKFQIWSSSQGEIYSVTCVIIKVSGPASALGLRNGDTVRVKGKITKARRALSPGEFDAYYYGLARGISGRITVKDAHLIAVMRHADNTSLLTRAKQTLRSFIIERVSPRDAGLLLALIIGDVRLFDDAQQAQYRNIGAGHLLAVSGLQVSMLGVIFYRLLLFLFLLIPWISRRSMAKFPAVVTAIGLIWGFVLLCGIPPSAVRAGLMTTLVLLASLYGWRTDSMDVLGASGLIILILSPMSVLDPSLWLSFAAVFGLILAASALKISHNDIVLLNPEKTSKGYLEKTRATLASSLGAGLLTLPFGIYFFAQVAPSGFLVNLVLVPIAGILQTPAILFSAMGILLNLDWPVLWGAFFAGVLDSICITLNNWIGQSVLLEPISLIGLLIAIACAVLLVLSVNPNRRRLKWILSAGFLTIIVVPSIFWESSLMRVTFLPVGQGDAVVLEIPKSGVIVVDGGGSHDNAYNPGERVITPYLRRRHIENIDVIVLSHPDADHLMGLLPLIENFHVKELWHNELDESHPLMAILVESARKHDVKIVSRSSMPDTVQFGNATINVLSLKDLRSDLRKLTSTNNRSLVLRVEFQGKSVLLTGDIESEMEHELILSGKSLDSTIVKAGHHGSRTSSSEEIIQATKAKHIVFCTGVNNRFGFPHAQVIERWKNSGAILWNTAVNGETTFFLGRDIAKAQPFIESSEEKS